MSQVYYESRWVPHREALHELSMCRAQFFNLRRSKVLLSPLHYYRNGYGSRAPLMVNVPAVRFALQAHFGG